MNPFELEGPLFLVVFTVTAVLAVLAAWGLRVLMREPSAPLPEEPALTPYELGYLAGGPLAVHTALAHMVDAGILGFDHATNRLSKRSDAEAKGPLEQAIVAAGPSFEVKQAYEVSGPVLDQMRKRLEDLGLLLTRERTVWARLLPPLLLLLVVVFGVIKIGVGISRDRPVAFLFIGCGVVLGISLILALRRVVLSRRGADLLTRLREKHAALQTSARKAPATLAGRDLTLAVGLFGAGVLAGGSFAGLHRAMRPAAAGGWIDSGGGAWSSCSSGWSGCGTGWASTCGSGCSGGGGDGGGGGCGGCGGGGGD